MANNKLLTVSIVTPEGTVYKTEDAKVVIAPAVLGEVAILPRHAPLFTRLKAGEITIKTLTVKQTFAVFGGFMDVNPESQVTILADFAKRSEELTWKQPKKPKKKQKN